MKKAALIVGHSGFLGRIILSSFHTKIECLSRSSGHYRCDLRYHAPHFENCYETVLCFAGKAHGTPRTEREKQEFFLVNFEGIKNLVKGLDDSNSIPKHFIFASTVSVYGLEQGENLSEETARLGSSPYALSKIMAEDFLCDWAEKSGVVLTILRLPLVVGPNAPGNLRKMINGIRRGKYVSLGRGKARKSMVLAEDVAEFIPKIASIGGIYNLTDGVHPSFKDIETVILKQLGKSFIPSCPLFIAKVLGALGDLVGEEFPINSAIVAKMTSTLTFNDEKARKTSLWKPRSVVAYFQI